MRPRTRTRKHTVHTRPRKDLPPYGDRTLTIDGHKVAITAMSQVEIHKRKGIRIRDSGPMEFEVSGRTSAVRALCTLKMKRSIASFSFRWGLCRCDFWGYVAGISLGATGTVGLSIYPTAEA
jgi:hypothetical protein